MRAHTPALIALLLAPVLLAAPAAAEDWHHGPPSNSLRPAPIQVAPAPIQVAPAPKAALSVVNQAGGPVNVSVAGGPPVALTNLSALQTAAPAGPVDVRVTYRQFGQERLLATLRADLRPDRSTTLIIPPERTARLLVQNRTTAPLTLFADGRALLDLPPGQSRVIERPAGTVDLALRLSRDPASPTAAAARVDLRPFAEPTLIAEQPKSADLVVQNPLPIPVEVICDRGIVRTIAPMSSVTYAAVPLGTFHLVARRVTDEVIQDMLIPVQPWVANAAAVPAPTRGLITLDSDIPATARLYIDGRSAGSLAANQERRLHLDVGWHQIVARDASGRTLRDQWIEVTPFDYKVMVIGQKPTPAAAYPAYPTTPITTAPAGSSCAMPPAPAPAPIRR